VTEAELTCKELTELITDYLEGRLPPADYQRFENHLTICPDCVAYVDQMRTTIKILGEKPRPEIPEVIKGDLLHAFREWKRK
jgi:anti-sigma factor RsiW